jgi:hypothetical protein
MDMSDFRFPERSHLAVVVSTVLFILMIHSEMSYTDTSSQNLVLKSVQNDVFHRPKGVLVAVCVVGRSQGNLRRIVNDLDNAFQFTLGVVNASLVVIYELEVIEDKHIPLNWSHGVIYNDSYLIELSSNGVFGNHAVLFLEDHMEISVFCAFWILSQIGVISSGAVLVGGGDFKDPCGLVLLGGQWFSLLLKIQLQGVDRLDTAYVLKNLMEASDTQVIFSTGIHGEKFIRTQYQNRLEPEVGPKLVRSWRSDEYQRIISSYQ